MSWAGVQRGSSWRERGARTQGKACRIPHHATRRRRVRQLLQPPWRCALRDLYHFAPLYDAYCMIKLPSLEPRKPIVKFDPIQASSLRGRTDPAGGEQAHPYHRPHPTHLAPGGVAPGGMFMPFIICFIACRDTWGHQVWDKIGTCATYDARIQSCCDLLQSEHRGKRGPQTRGMQMAVSGLLPSSCCCRCCCLNASAAAIAAAAAAAAVSNAAAVAAAAAALPAGWLIEHVSTHHLSHHRLGALLDQVLHLRWVGAAWVDGGGMVRDAARRRTRHGLGKEPRCW